MKRLMSALSVLATISLATLVLTPLASAQPIPGRASISPELQYAYETQSIEPLPNGTIIVGEPAQLTMQDVQPGTFLINGSLAPLTATFHESWPGFNGPVYELTYPLIDFIQGYFPFYDSTLHDFVVTADCTGTDFAFTGQVMLRGHALGDFNLNGRVTITDLTLLTAFLFREGTPPVEPGVTDMNRSGRTTVADVTSLIRYLFD